MIANPAYHNHDGTLQSDDLFVPRMSPKPFFNNHLNNLVTVAINISKYVCPIRAIPAKKVSLFKLLSLNTAILQLGHYIL